MKVSLSHGFLFGALTAGLLFLWSSVNVADLPTAGHAEGRDHSFSDHVDHKHGNACLGTEVEIVAGFRFSGDHAGESADGLHFSVHSKSIVGNDLEFVWGVEIRSDDGREHWSVTSQDVTALSPDTTEHGFAHFPEILRDGVYSATLFVVAAEVSNGRVQREADARTSLDFRIDGHHVVPYSAAEREAAQRMPRTIQVNLPRGGSPLDPRMAEILNDLDVEIILRSEDAAREMPNGGAR